jgi:hypothetical protein
MCIVKSGQDLNIYFNHEQSGHQGIYNSLELGNNIFNIIFNM